MRLPGLLRNRHCRSLLACRPFLFLFLLFPSLLAAQTGAVAGRVTHAAEGGPLAEVRVTVQGTTLFTLTGNDGRYSLKNVPAGPQVLTFRWIGYQPTEARVTVNPGETTTADVALTPAPVSIGELVVEGASRAPERQVEAPAAISVVEPQVLQNSAVTGQAPVAMQTIPGVDVVQNGVNDFNVNARGFNSSLNRRVLVLMDGRDLSIAFLGNQEWNSLAASLDELGRIEVVRGPGSALYGANAFSGVINITTPTAREVAGTKIALGGGGLETIRGDIRHAGVVADGRLGYKVMGGYNRSDTWTRSRTTNDGLDIAREYEDATDEVVGPSREIQPLAGQTRNATTGTAEGDRDALENYFGTARLDYYFDNGHVLTGEGSFASVANEVFVTGIGRVQVVGANKMYGRLMYSAPRFNIMGWWNNRRSDDSSDGRAQRSLATGVWLYEASDVYHLEGQYNRDFLKNNDARVILGSSYRWINTNTSGTLMRPEDDDRSDYIASLYAQLEYRLSPQLRLVGAARFDDGNLFDPQFSPKAAVVYSPTQDHSFRFSVNRAFMTPNYSEWFLRVAAGPPANLSALEAGLRASPLGPALAGVPQGQLFTTSSAVPVLALGNRDLVPEETLGWEVGYKGNITNRFYVTVDLYTAMLENFVTDLLPGVNPEYGPWTAPEEVPVQARPALEAAVRTILLSNPSTAIAGQGLTRIQDGSTAIVVSYTNAGRVQQYGAELGAGYQLTDELRVDATFTPFGFDVKEQAVGDQLIANTPGMKGTLSASYIAAWGLDASATLRLVDGYQWAAGVFQGYVPAQEMVNASVGYRFNNFLRASVSATNLFDQQRFSLYGGAVVGRRVLGQIEATF